MTTIVRITDATAVVRAATRRGNSCAPRLPRSAAPLAPGWLSGAGATVFAAQLRRRTRRARRVDQGRIHGRETEAAMRPHAITRYPLRRSVLLAALIACTAIPHQPDEAPDMNAPAETALPRPPTPLTCASSKRS